MSDWQPDWSEAKAVDEHDPCQIHIGDDGLVIHFSYPCSGESAMLRPREFRDAVAKNTTWLLQAIQEKAQRETATAISMEDAEETRREGLRRWQKRIQSLEAEQRRCALEAEEKIRGTQSRLDRVEEAAKAHEGKIERLISALEHHVTLGDRITALQDRVEKLEGWARDIDDSAQVTPPSPAWKWRRGPIRKTDTMALSIPGPASIYAAHPNDGGFTTQDIPEGATVNIQCAERNGQDLWLYSMTPIQFHGNYSQESLEEAREASEEL
jgi:hypothetical protein